MFIHMQLAGNHTTSFALEIVGYQFPRVSHERYDSDWLDIALRVADPRGNWSPVSPCLLTWEIVELADWLEGLVDAHTALTTLSFIEPNLRFEAVRKEALTIQVYFDQESRPPWHPSRFGFEATEPAWIELHPLRMICARRQPSYGPNCNAIQYVSVYRQ